MTDKELQDAGWQPRDCRIGTLYFKGSFFCRIKKDGIAVIYRCSDDMNPIGYAGTVEDFKPLMQKSDLAEIELMEAELRLMKLAYEKEYQMKFKE